MDKNRDILTQTLEQTGHCGTVCGIPDNDAITNFLIMPSEDFRDLALGVTNPKDRKEVVCWDEYIEWMPSRKEAYHEYLRSPAWKRKRDMVLEFAMCPIDPPENVNFKWNLNPHGRIIEYIEVEWKPICEAHLVDCTTIAVEVHHHNYDNVGKEDISADLIAVCKSCHYTLHLKRLERMKSQ